MPGTCYAASGTDAAYQDACPTERAAEDSPHRDRPARASGERPTFLFFLFFPAFARVCACACVCVCVYATTLLGQQKYAELARCRTELVLFAVPRTICSTGWSRSTRSVLV
eukprot:1381690-Rhodomonas_salina.8